MLLADCQDSQADNGAGLENQFLIGSGVQIPVLAPFP